MVSRIRALTVPRESGSVNAKDLDRRKSARIAANKRKSNGSVRTPCRIGTSGRMESTSRAAESAMRRPEHDGQSPRVLHENGTARSSPQAVQTQRAKPRVRSPQTRCGFPATSGGADGRGRPHHAARPIVQRK